MNNYGVALKLGSGVEKNPKEAVRYLKMAIEKGYDDAMHVYAAMLRDGDGIPKDKAEAARYFTLVIDKGNEASKISYALN